MNTIFNGPSSITPDLIDGYASSRPVNNLVHTLLDGNISVSLRPTGPRTGTLELFFAAEADVVAAEEFHLNTGTFVLTSTERPSFNMSYILAEGGQLKRELDDETRNHWKLFVDYQEVLV